MKEPTMLFRAGDSEIIWGTPMDTITVDAREVESYLTDGWVRHPDEVTSPMVMETIGITDEESNGDDPDPAKPRRGRPPKNRDPI